MEWAIMQAMTRLGTVLFFGGAAVSAMMVTGVSQIHPAAPAGLVVVGLAVAALGATPQILRTYPVLGLSAEALQRLNKRREHHAMCVTPPFLRRFFIVNEAKKWYTVVIWRRKGQGRDFQKSSYSCS